VKDDNWMIYIVAFALLVGFGAWYWSQDQNCDAKGGVLVQAPTWGGYECVQKAKP
jgi:hypothetical protein